MFPYEFYKVMHLVGVLMVFLSLGGVATHVINGGTKNQSWRKPIALTHGLGLLLSLVGGFGLLARLGIAQAGFPVWVHIKILLWLVFGGLIAVLYRKPQLAKVIWFLMILLGASAAYLARYKPF